RRSPIAILPSVVVDQIAAGEVVQRPVSVVKELIENSLDAKATHIVVQFDGLKKMSITDNGNGVKKSDLPLLCTRHATSKLISVDDFSDLSTFGFRGEALASTSMVSRLVTVVSRVPTATVVAYSQSYQNGKPTQPKAKPCASKAGTKITIEDLFYNVPHRQQAYSKRESEEYGKIHRIVQDYAVHYPTVGFVCQRTSSSKGKHKTLIVDCNTGQIPAVKILLQSRDSAAAAAAKSSSLTKETQRNNNDDDNSHNQQQQQQQQRKFIIFLNHRLVDLPPLKRALEDVYSDFGNPNRNKNIGKPVLVVNLKIPGSQVDVNVHPSKRQVALMFQEDLVTALAQKLRQRLEEHGQQFVAQSVVIRNPYADDQKDNKNKKRKQSSVKKVVPSKLIRTNNAVRAGAIEPFLVSTQQSVSSTQDDTTRDEASQPLSRSVLHAKYASIASLRKRVGKQQCPETTQQIRTAFFMGALSNQRSLIQCGEDLVMINHLELAKELFYQLALARFGGGAKLAHLGSVGSNNGGIHIQAAIAQALQCEDDLLHGMLQVSDTNDNLAHQATARLVESSGMLEEYFSIRIEIRKSTEDNVNRSKDNNDDVTEDAILTCLPVLLDGHQPQSHALPLFLLRLATQVDWSREKHCFHGICKEIGNFYAMLPSQSEDLNSYVQHNLFPALSYLLLPSKNQVRNGHYTNMTKLSTLYKVFERC
ncbi:hypothetical protein FRACYDRAFT_136590, partial [Fragilariopsis cylindrus CCMP1102]